MNNNCHNQERELPQKMIVTLKAGGYFFALANVVCVAILAWAFVAVKWEPKTLSVTGSAHKAIVSDLVTWSGAITAADEDLVKAYDTLKSESDEANAFVVASGIPRSEITLSSITTTRHYKKEVVKAAPGLSVAASEAPAIITTDTAVVSAKYEVR